VLCAVAIDSKELRYRKFELTKLLVLVSSVPVQIDQVLDGPFPISGCANDDASAVILDCTCKDFRGRRAVAVYQHGERPTVDNCGVCIPFYPDTALRVLDLYDRSFLDEKAGESCCFGKRPAAVPPQVDDQPICMLRPQLSSRVVLR